MVNYQQPEIEAEVSDAVSEYSESQDMNLHKAHITPWTTQSGIVSETHSVRVYL